MLCATWVQNNILTYISYFILFPDHERIALGNEEGLYVIHVTKDGRPLAVLMKAVVVYLFFSWLHFCIYFFFVLQKLSR